MKYKNKITGEIVDFKMNHINSKDFCSQQRNRYYWCSWDAKNPTFKSTDGLEKVLQPDADIDMKFKISDKLHKFFLSHTKKRTGRVWKPRDISKKAVALTARYYKMSADDNYVDFDGGVRKLTPIECERLQTLNENYTAKGIDETGKTVDVSNTQRYKSIGNGWTADVITFMFKQIK